jgi:hypothetical protein
VRSDEFPDTIDRAGTNVGAASEPMNEGRVIEDFLAEPARFHAGRLEERLNLTQQLVA